MNLLLQDIVALLAITNPLGAIPAFLAVTNRMDFKVRRRAGMRAAVAVGLILAAAAVAGRPILLAFGISMPAFQAAGGLVILLMGLEMLRGAPTRIQYDAEADESAEEHILVPVAMPLVAGPGAIATTITLSSRTSTWSDLMVLLIAAVVVAVVSLVTFSSAHWVSSKVGVRGQRIFLRFMGLILAAVGAQVLLSGLYSFRPGP
jgi:multiple antibiotic resistance protein